ncbi:CAP domain-containing protein [Pedobacter arcticus]|uniref:CAP domain-containing protein n=1 Tax=Pedobacter arcticus TaxID=752140 RepID=UPI0002E9A5E7|nr:CAP domain-containing protein [Pedobacter arcticus]
MLNSKNLIKILFILFYTTVTGCKKEELPAGEKRSKLVMQQINILRVSGCKCGDEFMPAVSPLLINTQLETAAKKHATDMFISKYFDHVSLSGKTPSDRVYDAGYDGVFIGEILAQGYFNAEKAVNAWQQSVSHCKSMMNPDAKEIGAAEDQGYYVAEFGN